MNRFMIYPAIDLRGGKVVRLLQGNRDQQTTYFDNPEAVVEKWGSCGFKWIHIVNLDGAFGEKENANQKAIENIIKIASALNVKTQLGGGIRNMDQIDLLLNAGINRVILGTVAVENPAIVDLAVQKYDADRILVGIDALNGIVRTQGWMKESNLTAVNLGKRLKDQGIKSVIFTDIARDGTKSGVNMIETIELASQSGLEVIASGGIQSIEDVMSLKESNIPGVVIGKALYDGLLDIDELSQLQEGGLAC